MSDRSTIDSRRERLLAYLKHNSGQLLVDAAVLLSLVIATSVIFDWLGLPTWLYYLVLFTGIVVYAAATPNWERPYNSPD